MLLSGIGILLFIFSIGWLIFSLITKKGVRKPAIGLLSGIVLLVVGVATYDIEETDDTDMTEETVQAEAEVEKEDKLLRLSEEEKDLLEDDYGELSSSDQEKVNGIINEVDEYEEDDRELINENKDRINEEKLAFKEKAKKEKEEQEAIDKQEQEEREKAEKEQEEKDKAQKELEEKEKYNSGVSRNDMARDKDGLVGEYVTFSGKVSQVMEGDGYNQYRFAVDDDLDQMILIEINDDLLDSNILEDDYIKIEGISFGNMTYETVLGSEKTIPGVIVENVYLD